MSISVNLQVTSQLDTAGGANVPSPTDTFSSTASVGTYSAGPIAVAVTSTPAALPLSAAPGTAVYWLCVANVGATALILDMQNTASASSKLTIAPGGRVYFHNVTLAISGTGNAAWPNWRLSTASSTTTANVSLVYT